MTRQQAMAVFIKALGPLAEDLKVDDVYWSIQKNVLGATVHWECALYNADNEEVGRGNFRQGWEAPDDVAIHLDGTPLSRNITPAGDPAIGG